MQIGRHGRYGFWILDSGFWILSSLGREGGAWNTDWPPRPIWILDSGFWILDSEILLKSDLRAVSLRAGQRRILRIRHALCPVL
jgi:hypothetical protein